MLLDFNLFSGNVNYINLHGQNAFSNSEENEICQSLHSKL